jgi:hypothetical protein
VNERLQRIGAIVRADLLIRLRRVSTLVVFLLLSATAYLWVPAPSAGRTLLEMNGKRAIYNSAAIGLGTAMLAAVFIGLVGFYVISNALRRDVETRCGYVIASTTVRGSEYLFGKLLGNIAFLSLLIGGFMVTAMAMQLMRAEAPLQPLVFVWQYVLLVTPTIVFVSALAVTFESVPFLSGKFGDVVYFFVWMVSFALVAAMTEKTTGPGIAGYFDFTSFGFMLDTLKHALGTTQVSIGQSSFDPKKGVFVFPGLTLTREWIAPRLFSIFAPFSLLLVARMFFHRFDPARVRAAAQKGSGKWLGRLTSLTKPLGTLAWLLTSARGARASRPREASGLGDFANACRTETAISLTSAPISIVIAVGIAIASIATPAKSFINVALPIAIAMVAILIADLSCRESRAGTTGLIYSMPLLKPAFVFWKFVSALVFALLVLAGPAIRIAVTMPRILPAFLAGVICTVAFATFLGIASSNPKTFIVVFLSFWYLVMNDQAHTSALAFAGFNGTATPGVIAGYFAAAIGALALAQVIHQQQLRRSF